VSETYLRICRVLIIYLFRSPRLSPVTEDNWEFDTVRGANPTSDSGEDLVLSDLDEEAAFSQSLTIRPPGISNVPSSLRLLFQDDADKASDPFNLPTGLPPLMANINLLPSPVTAPSTTPRDRPGIKRAWTTDSSGNGPHDTHRPEFVFPPRPSPARSFSKNSSGEPEVENGKAHQSSEIGEILTPLGPGTPSGMNAGTDLTSSDNKSQPTQREAKSPRSPHAIETTLLNSESATDSDLPSGTPAPLPTSTLEPSVQPKRSILNRKRSQSSVGDVGGRSLGSHEYRFPIPLDTALPLAKITNLNVNDSNASSSKTGTQKSSPIRQASLSAMESLSLLPLLPPVPPFLNTQRKRSGSGASGNSDNAMQNVPDLRDVLKVQPF
jgi:hypothetical protein